jgi:hypothetical protein
MALDMSEMREDIGLKFPSTTYRMELRITSELHFCIAVIVMLLSGTNFKCLQFELMGSMKMLFCSSRLKMKRFVRANEVTSVRFQVGRFLCVWCSLVLCGDGGGILKFGSENVLTGLHYFGVLEQPCTLRVLTNTFW